MFKFNKQGGLIMSFLKMATQHQENSISIKAIKGKQFGKVVYSSQESVENILAIFEIDSTVQRELISDKVANLKQYIHQRLEDKQHTIYFPPFVFSARKHGTYNEKELSYKIQLNNKITVLDGQHRLVAFQSVIDRFKNSNDENDQKKYELLRKWPVSLQIFADLNIEQEQQLFSDINSKATRVGANLIKYYDTDNITSKLMRDIVHNIANYTTLKTTDFELRLNLTRKKLTTGLIVYKLIANLDSGKIIQNNSSYQFEESQYSKLFKKTVHFLHLLEKYRPSNAYDRSKSIYLNQSVIMAIAKSVRELPCEEWESFFQRVVSTYDWGQQNQELIDKKIPYNYQTKRFRLSKGFEIIKIVESVLINKAVQEGFYGLRN